MQKNMFLERWQKHGLLYLLNLFLFISLLGCVEKTESASFAITSVQPQTLEPETTTIIKGRGFGESLGTVAISGMPLEITSWAEQKVVALLPRNIPRGARYLVLSQNGKQTAPFPVFIEGELASSPSRTDMFLPMPDLSQRDATTDMLMPPVDQMMGIPVQVSLDKPEAGIIITAQRRDDFGSPELWVSFVARQPNQTNGGRWSEEPLWGVASHLTYPTDRLDFILMKDEPSRNIAAVKGDLPGRIFWYHGNLNLDESAQQATLITLRFSILDPTDSTPFRLELPRRFTSVRGKSNQRLAYEWSGGQIQLIGGNP